MDLKIKKILHIAAVAAIALYLIGAPFFLFPAFLSQPLPPDLTGEGNFLMLWHVDSFEAGSGSMSTFLERRAVNFEKANKGTFVVVKKLTLEQAKLQLENGYLPDLVSFGLGAGELFESYLVNYTGAVFTRPALAEAGEIGSAQKALPWCMGGYMLAAKNGVLESSQSVLQEALDTGEETKNKKQFSLSYGGETNVSLLALLNGNKAATTQGKVNPIYTDSFTQTQYQSYANFVSEPDTNILLGSQRDYARLINRERNGQLDACRYEFLEGFSDLVSFIGLTTNDGVKYRSGVKFIEYLTNEAAQELLPSIGMFSVNGKFYHTEDGYREYERAINKELKTINVFTSVSRITEIKSLCLGALNGQAESKNKLKEFLV